MLDQDHRQAVFLPDAVNQRRQVRCFLRVHAGRRFIQVQDLGLDRQGTGNFQLPLLAIGQIHGQLVSLGIQAHFLQVLAGLFLHPALLGIVLRQPQDGTDDAIPDVPVHGNLDVFQHRHFPEQPDVLERPGHTEIRDFIWRQSADLRRLAVHIHFDQPFAGFIHPCKQIEQRGFPRTIGANQSDQFPRLDVKGHIRHSRQAAEVPGEILYLQNGFHQLASFPASCLARILLKESSRFPSRPLGLKIIMMTSARP